MFDYVAVLRHQNVFVVQICFSNGNLSLVYDVRDMCFFMFLVFKELYLL